MYRCNSTINLDLLVVPIVHSKDVKTFPVVHTNLQMNGGPSVSRNGSVSSRGSVRITITNLAETNGNIQDLDSPGSTLQVFTVLSFYPSFYSFVRTYI